MVGRGSWVAGKGVVGKGRVVGRGGWEGGKVW